MNILLLGKKSNLLIDKLLSLGHNADIICDKITIETAKKYDFLISFGYSYILKKEVQDDIQNDTLKTSYDSLISEIVMLFNNNAENILNGSISSYSQTINNINYIRGGAEQPA